jgi:hypothetical protein
MKKEPWSLGIVDVNHFTKAATAAGHKIQKES